MSDESKTYDFLTRTLAEQFGMPPEDFRTAVISQCFPGGAATPYQVTQFLMVAYNRKLNPFEKGEIYAFVNKAGVLTIGTGRDGWTKIAHRNPHFKGFKSAEVVGKDGEFLGIHMQMKRDDWEEPGEYTAYLEEWNKQVLNKNGWDNQPRHLTFVKAWQECTKVTFAVTDVATEDEIEAIKSADEENVGQPIYQPAPESQQAIEHQPAEVANFTEIQQPEKVPVRKGRPAGSKNKLKGDTADARKSGDLCWVCGDAAKQVQDYGERKFGTCALHASEVHPDEKLIRESWDADKATAAQTHAGLEVVDPNESELETFIRVHDLEPRRVDATLAKFGADKVSDLAPADAARMLEIFKKSVAVMEAAAKGA